MNALLLVALLNGSTPDIPAIVPIPQAQVVLTVSYTPPNLGIPQRRRGAGTR
jgi:hypothetical protein